MPARDMAGPGRTLQTLYPGQTAAGRLPALLTS